MRDSLGIYRFISWKSQIPAEERKFGDIWKIHRLNKYIFFQSRTHLLIFDNDGEYITAMHPENEFIFSFLVNIKRNQSMVINIR